MSSAQQQQQSSMSFPPSPLVWFLLLDFATGLPYKGTTVSSVLRSSLVVPVVDQFRDAVKKKDKDDGDAAILTSFKSSQLPVYKNKASFDKRNADDGMEEPLDPTESLDLLGSKEDMLAVAVPSSAENPSGKFTAADIVLAVKELNQTNLVIAEELRENNQTNLVIAEELRENNKFLKKTAKNDFSLLKPKSYKSDNHDIRLQWLIHYGMVSPTSTVLPQDAYCHLLGVQVPLKYLNCSHLFQKRWHRHVRDFGLSSINSGKNILILLKIFEEAFDAGRFVLLVDKQRGLIRCKIIDNELKNKNLDEAMKDVFPNYRTGDVDFKGKTCFGDFDGQELHFLNPERPFTRCLSFHALVAREHAIDYGWIGEDELKELDDDDMWSDGFLDEKTRKFIDEWRVDVCSSQLSSN